MSNHNEKPFIGRLESMRGVASVFVAICHSFIWCFVFGQPVEVRPISEVEQLQPIIARIVISITNGAAWVDLFFVLSGFVLTRSLLKQEASIAIWRQFIVKRIIRIVPAFFAALCLISVLLWLRSAFHLFPHADDGWYPRWHFTTVSVGRFVQNILFLTPELDAPSWTLRIEMIAALSLPFLVVLFRSISLRAAVTICAAFAVVSCGLDWFGPVPYLSIAYAVVERCIGSYMFMIGIVCALHSDRITSVMRDWQLSAAALVSFIAMSLIHLPFREFTPLAHAIAGLGSFWLVAVLSTNRRVFGFGWLDHGSIRFMGRISFSFYLLHYAVLYAVVLVLTEYKIQPLAFYYPLAYMTASAVISIALCIPISWCIYRYVELPSMTWSRRLSSGQNGAKSQSGSVRHAVE